MSTTPDAARSLTDAHWTRSLPRDAHWTRSFGAAGDAHWTRARRDAHWT